jgi:hypothetical protein
MKPFLVLLRRGPASPPLAGLGSLTEAGFDVALSWSGPVAPLLPGAVFVHVDEDSDGSKWSALGRTMLAHGAQVEGYRHLWLPDDDVAFDAETLSRLFLICDQLGIELGQPAFEPGSSASHPVALLHRDFQLRFTNHVDMSAPVLSHSMLAKVLPTLTDPALRPETLWPRLSRLGRVAIIDATPVARPPRQLPHAAAHDDLVNLGGLLDSGDAWCLGPQSIGVEVMLRALMNSCAALNLGAQDLTRYLAHHLALVDSGAVQTIQAELERELRGAGMRFNCAAPPLQPSVTDVKVSGDELAPRALVLCEADLHDLQLRYLSVVHERALQDELLARLADQLEGLAQEVSAPTPAARRIEAV